MESCNPSATDTGADWNIFWYKALNLSIHQLIASCAIVDWEKKTTPNSLTAILQLIGGMFIKKISVIFN